jgi:hypothetical protein
MKTAVSILILAALVTGIVPWCMHDVCHDTGDDHEGCQPQQVCVTGQPCVCHAREHAPCNRQVEQKNVQSDSPVSFSFGSGSVVRVRPPEKRRHVARTASPFVVPDAVGLTESVRLLI